MISLVKCFPTFFPSYVPFLKFQFWVTPIFPSSPLPLNQITQIYFSSEAASLMRNCIWIILNQFKTPINRFKVYSMSEQQKFTGLFCNHLTKTTVVFCNHLTKIAFLLCDCLMKINIKFYDRFTKTLVEHWTEITVLFHDRQARIAVLFHDWLIKIDTVFHKCLIKTDIVFHNCLMKIFILFCDCLANIVDSKKNLKKQKSVIWWKSSISGNYIINQQKLHYHF